MEDPLEFLRTAEVGTLLAVAGATTTVCARFFPSLATPAASKGIISLELAWTRSRAAGIIDSWRLRRLEGAAKRSVCLDFLFIVLYSAALGLLGVMSGRAAVASELLSSEHGATVGTALAIAACVAGLCDCIEDVGLLVLLSGHLKQPIPTATSAFSLLKWLLLTSSVLGSLGVLMASGIAAL